MEFITTYHACNIGDIFATLAGLRQLSISIGKKIIFTQQLNATAYYYTNAIHGTVDNSGNMVTMNDQIWSMVKPLLEAQDYIERADVFTGQHIDYDLNKIRGEINVHIPLFPIQKWIMYAFAEMQCSLDRPWIHVPLSDEINPYWDKVVINRTARYQNPNIHYFFLKKYESHLIFAGTEGEHKDFCQLWGLNMPRVQVKDFVELAQILLKCSFMLGNQSACWNLAQGLGSHRLLELCSFAPNCTNFGDNGYEFLHQSSLEYLFAKLFKERIG